MNVIEIDGLTKRFKGGWRRPGVVAVDDLSFTVQEGEVFGFLGPNGAGKTTTLYTLLGLLMPTSGGGAVFGRPFGELEALARVGFLPEYVNLHDYYTADGLLNYYARLSRLDSATARERVSYVLERLDLASTGRKRVVSFSRGMIQRMGLAQAFLGDPDLLILDEPTSSLDPVGRKEVKDLLLGLKERGKTILISSHILSDIESLCDRVVIIQNGGLVATGTIDELVSAGGGVRITSENVPPEAAQKIQQLGGATTESEGVLTVDLLDHEKEYEVITILHDHGCPLTSVAAQKSSLEDVFVDLVKGEQPQ